MPERSWSFDPSELFPYAKPSHLSMLSCPLAVTTGRCSWLVEAASSLASTLNQTILKTRSETWAVYKLSQDLSAELDFRALLLAASPSRIRQRLGQTERSMLSWVSHRCCASSCLRRRKHRPASACRGFHGPFTPPFFGKHGWLVSPHSHKEHSLKECRTSGVVRRRSKRRPTSSMSSTVREWRGSGLLIHRRCLTVSPQPRFTFFERLPRGLLCAQETLDSEPEPGRSSFR
jgi:hypothetical protein